MFRTIWTNSIMFHLIIHLRHWFWVCWQRTLRYSSISPRRRVALPLNLFIRSFSRFTSRMSNWASARPNLFSVIAHVQIEEVSTEDERGGAPIIWIIACKDETGSICPGGSCGGWTVNQTITYNNIEME